jgi:hypothetical protein
MNTVPFEFVQTLPRRNNCFPNRAKAYNALYNALLEVSGLIENLPSFVTISLP